MWQPTWHLRITRRGYNIPHGGWNSPPSTFASWEEATTSDTEDASDHVDAVTAYTESDAAHSYCLIPRTPFRTYHDCQWKNGEAIFETAVESRVGNQVNCFGNWANFFYSLFHFFHFSLLGKTSGNRAIFFSFVSSSLYFLNLFTALLCLVLSS